VNDRAPAPPAQDGGLSTIDVITSIVVMFVFAVAQPLLDLLGRNAEFFLARGTPQLDILLLGLGLAVGIPLLLGLAVAGVNKANRTAGQIVHGIVFAILSGMLVLQIISMTPLDRMPGWGELVVAGAAGVGIWYAYDRSETLRAIGRYASVAPVVVLGLFLFVSPVSQLVFASGEIAKPSQVTVENPAPIVMVIFDEFPIASLMDGDGAIDPDIYPGFARLVEDGTWFRNAATVQQQTENSIPAILSGKNPPPGKLPTASDHPLTLFTLLADSYDLHVSESVTDLCPEYACENATRPSQPFASRWGDLFDDLRIVSGHLFLPNDMAADLPAIDTTWSNFSGGDHDDIDMVNRFRSLTYDADRRTPINRFVTELGRPPTGDEPDLYFLHALVPHVPWTYLPSGQLYGSPPAAPGSASPGWGPDEWLVDQAYQEHLMQVGYVDTIVGEIIEALEGAGTYDETMIIILADHGIAVRPNIEHRRVATEDTLGDIAAIPLFIKRPHQDSGEIDDYRAETVDVLPTIAGVLGVDVPWSMVGIPLFADTRPERTESRISGSKGTIVFPADSDAARAIAARKTDHFGPNGPFGLAPPGYADLLGQGTDPIYIEAAETAIATIRDADVYDDVDLDGPMIPSWISGRIRGVPDGTGDVIVAIVVNGRIAAVTRSDTTEEGVVEYGAIIPPGAFRDGKNYVRPILVRETPDGREFLELGR